MSNLSIKTIIVSISILTIIVFGVKFFFPDSDKNDNKDIVEAELRIQNHKFEPEILKLPAGKKIRLRVNNLDSTVEEFESTDLKREKIVPANSSVYIVIAPLKAGTYKFFGEFHEATAQGKIEVANQPLNENASPQN